MWSHFLRAQLKTVICSDNLLSPWCEETTHWKRPWCWERLKAGGEGDNRGWGGWVASLTWWIWVWANSRRWWRTGKPGVLQSMGSQSQTRLTYWTTSVGQALFWPLCSYYFTLYKTKYLIPFIQMVKLVLTLITSELDVNLYRLWEPRELISFQICI